MEHTVKKSKVNRIAMRLTAIVFLAVGALSFYALTSEKPHSGRLLFMILCAGCLIYGIYLFAQTLKAQAYDITYVFGDTAMTLKLHRGERVYSYGDITQLFYVVPNENLDYGVVQIYIGKEQYVIPFMGNSNVGEALYGMLKLKKDEMTGNA
ncbi:MAG: hypothetical protein K2L07_03060 [Lachnospiraceae bacterium]|nr:hypothetical protein [Lachnospiraceae bacterium]